MPHFTPKNEELCPEPTVITFQAKSGTSPTVQAEEGLDGRWKQLLPSKKIEEGRKKTSVRPGSPALDRMVDVGSKLHY